MSYKNSIKKLNELFLSFISQTSTDFSSKNLQKRLTKQTNSLNYTSFHIGNDMERILSNSPSQYNLIIENSSKEKDEMFKMLNQEIDTITANFKKQKLEALEEYNSKKESIHDKQDLLEQDINYFTLTTSQTIDVVKDEYEDNLRRFDYQIKNANEHYKESIDENNKLSNLRLKELHDNHINSLEIYKIELDEIINILQEQINNKRNEYDELKKKFNDVKNVTKEKLLQESIILNETIKVLSNEKAVSIDKAKEKNANSIALFNAQKERLHNEVSLNVKNIQRDFVVNLSSLEDKLTNIKHKHEISIDKEKRRYYYELFEINKRQNKELENIMKDEYSSEQEEKSAKKIIKSKNKQYFKQINEAKKQNNINLKKLELNLQKDMEYNRYKRVLLELNKNAALKKNADKEQFKNKAFQEEDNIFEIELKLTIDTANKKYNQKANVVKCQNQIKSKGLKKDLDLSESNFLKKLEMIETEINVKKAEIEEAKNLYNLMVQFEKDKYKKTRQYYIVSSLLETEKGKLLNEYNQIKYNQSIENALKLYLFTSNKFEIENKKFEVVSNLKIKLEDIKQDRERLILEFNNNKIDMLEDKAKQLVFRRNQYVLNNINQDTLTRRFNVEFDCIATITDTYIALINEMYNYNERILRILYDSLPNNNSKGVSSVRYMSIINNYYSLLIDDLCNLLSEVIYRHTEFEERFKYRQYYNSLLLNYETENKKYGEKKKRFEETLINYEKTVDNFNNKIYSCQNEISMLNHRMKVNTQGKEIYTEQIAKNNQLIKELKTKIKDIEKMRKIIIDDIAKNEIEINKLEISYTDRVEEIKALQYTNSKAYNTFKRNINLYKNFAKNKIEGLTVKVNPDKFNEHDFIKKYNEKILKINKILESEIKKVTSKFKFSTEEMNKLVTLKNKTEYIKDCRSIKKRSEFNLHNAKSKHNNKLSNNNQEQSSINTEIQRETNRYNYQINALSDKNNTDNKNLLSDQRKKLNNFYSNYNSLCDNIEEINNGYRNEIIKLENDFNNEKHINAKNREKEVIMLNIRLNEFIRSKNDLISRLPGILKNEASILNKENRELNASISQLIKENVNNSELQKKIINRNISAVNDSLEQSNADIDKILQRDINKEKNTFNIRINHYNRELKKLKRGF